MNCPFCRISSMRGILSGGKEIDRCSSCGALWFDYGEVRELTECRILAEAGSTGPMHGKAATESNPPEKPRDMRSRAHAAARSLGCPRCGGNLTAMDFQATGIPVLHCTACEGILAPRESAAGIHAKFRFLRENESKFAALAETLAGESRRRMETKYGPAAAPGGNTLPLPVVFPVADEAPETGPPPLVTYALVILFFFLHIVGQVKGAPLPLPGGLDGLPSGTGFAGIPKLPLVFSPFFHAGILPLIVGSLFLLVLGDNVEERVGKVSYAALFLFCGVVSGAAHVLWGKAGGAAAQGSAGAVAGILGAYVVFFPEVSINMYGMGRLVRLPAYLFACTWVIAAFLLARDPGPLMEFLNPASLSLAGNIAGFGTGVFCAIAWRFWEGGKI